VHITELLSKDFPTSMHRFMIFGKVLHRKLLHHPTCFGRDQHHHRGKVPDSSKVQQCCDKALLVLLCTRNSIHSKVFIKVELGNRGACGSAEIVEHRKNKYITRQTDLYSRVVPAH
jgi:hypothetical protein